MILCAAIKLRGDQYKPDGFVVVPCWRHGVGYRILHDLTGNASYKGNVEEGFIDHMNNFLDRKEALMHALSCGQLSASTKELKHDHGEEELYSEDLY